MNKFYALWGQQLDNGDTLQLPPKDINFILYRIKYILNA